MAVDEENIQILSTVIEVTGQGLKFRFGEFLSRHRLVHAFLDNDKAGMDALDKLEGNLGKDTVLVNESVRLYPRHNDFNEFLQACKKKAMTAGNEM